MNYLLHNHKHFQFQCHAYIKLLCLGLGLWLISMPSYGDISPDKISLNKQTLYSLLLAEIAWDRQEYDTALQQYLSLSKHNEAPSIAKRATEMALLLNYLSEAEMAASRWASLETTNAEAQTVAIALSIKANHLNAAKPYLQQFFSLENPEKVRNFMLLISQLNHPRETNQLFQLIQALPQEHYTLPIHYFLLALSAEAAEQFDIALTATQQAREKQPDWIQAIALELRLLRKFSPEKSLPFLNDIINEHPHLHDIHWLYAEMLFEAQDYTQAAMVFNKLVTHPQYRINANIYLGKIAYIQQQYNQAADYFNDALALDKTHAGAHYHLGLLFEFENKHQQAINHYAQVGLGPHYINAQVKIAELIAIQDGLAHALVRLQALILSYPEEEKHLQLVSAQLLLTHDKPKEAYTLLSTLIEQNPNDLEFLYAQSIAALQLNKIDEAEYNLTYIIQKNPDHIDALNTLGYTLTKFKGRHQEALIYLKHALTLAPTNSAVIDSIGWVYYHLRQYPVAIKYLRQALKLNAHATIAAHLGEVLWRTGEKQEALEIWHAALKSHPNNALILNVMQQFNVGP